jgi:hypothetical protein
VSQPGQKLLPPNLQLVKYSTLGTLQLDETESARQDHEAIGDALRARGVQLDRPPTVAFCFVDQVLFD